LSEILPYCDQTGSLVVQLL